MHPNIDLAIRRFNLSAPPTRGEDKYEEKLTNWFLEGAFFRDFVFRNRPGKGGRGDLADGLVLFDRTALFVQSKAQDGDRDGRTWAAKNIRRALAQVGYGERMLRERLVPQVVSDTLGPVAFDPDRYTERMGLIVLDQDDVTSFVASELVPELARQSFPVHVLSLPDLMELATRFDTAHDFLFYLEERHHLSIGGVSVRVHAEVEMASAMLHLMPQRLRLHRPDVPEAVFERTVGAFRRKVTGNLRDSDDWRASAMVDDVIAKMHDRDPALRWNQVGSLGDVMKAAELLASLTRDRRVEIGRKLVQAIGAQPLGPFRSFWWGTRASKCVYVFLVSDMPREQRLDLLVKSLKSGMARCMANMQTELGVGVATNSCALRGRAHEVAVRLQPLTEEERAFWLAAPDPFGI